MSKIESEILKALGDDFKDVAKETPLARRTRMVKMATRLKDTAWNTLSEPAQDFVNDSGELIMKKKDCPEFPDADKSPAKEAAKEAAAEPKEAAAKEKPAEKAKDSKAAEKSERAERADKADKEEAKAEEKGKGEKADKGEQAKAEPAPAPAGKTKKAVKAPKAAKPVKSAPAKAGGKKAAAKKKADKPEGAATEPTPRKRKGAIYEYRRARLMHRDWSEEKILEHLKEKGFQYAKQTLITQKGWTDAHIAIMDEIGYERVKK